MKSTILRTGLSALTIALLAGATSAAEPHMPHRNNTDYTEDFRPQFHFSPKSEWMNDINALIYQDGVYHMIYQWGRAVRHGGYATSTDLLHWDDKGVALVPQGTFLPKGVPRNVSGQAVYSGSGVLVDGEVAKGITGSTKPAMVTHYTGTKVGTCIAWSNDQGATWHDYKNNPVAHPTKGALPRDPCVFWYEPTKTWILALYEKGTTFYGSKDLIKWDKLSNIKFGFECPDVFQLPLDGDPAKMKWVLQDAVGAYLVGQFNGKEFIKEQKETLVMDKGPDFYAGQSFFPHNLPEKKVIQIAWNDHWNGGVGEKGWQRNATFPVELGLVTHDGKMQVTRTPISAISNLYQKTSATEEKTLTPGENILARIQSKAFDMTAVFDLTDTTAKTIQFKIADRTMTYKIPEQVLVGKKMTKVKRTKEEMAREKKGQWKHVPSKVDLKLKPDFNNQLTIRILVDWSNIEIFAQGGVFSYSENVALDPKSSHVGIAVDGKVKLKSLEFHEIKSIWKK